MRGLIIMAALVGLAACSVAEPPADEQQNKALKQLSERIDALEAERCDGETL